MGGSGGQRGVTTPRARLRNRGGRDAGVQAQGSLSLDPAATLSPSDGHAGSEGPDVATAHVQQEATAGS